MDYQSGAEFWLKPGGLGRHDVARIGNIHKLFHGDRIECQSHLHLTAVNTALEFSKTAYATNKINPLVAAQVLYTKQLVQNQVL